MYWYWKKRKTKHNDFNKTEKKIIKNYDDKFENLKYVFQASLNMKEYMLKMNWKKYLQASFLLCYRGRSFFTVEVKRIKIVVKKGYENHQFW